MKRLISNLESTFETTKVEGQCFEIYLECIMSPTATSCSDVVEQLDSETFAKVSQTLSHVADKLEIRDVASSKCSQLTVADYIVEMETIATIRMYKEYGSVIIELESNNNFIMELTC